FEEYLTSFENHYQTSSMTQKEREKFFNSFLESVSKIDSSINIVSKITDNKSDSIHIYQQFRFQTQCNTSTTYQPKDYRENFLNISGDYFCLEDMEQYLVDIPVGNGNYLLTLIKPKKQTLKQYLKDFDEKQYAELLKETKSQKINFSFPILEFSKQEEIINLSDTCLNFSFSMPKKIILDYDFKIENSPNTNISFEETLLNDSNKEPLIFDKDFLFILRGKNSNFIMCIGYYGFEN
ncbi:MAG: hypothetical protein Q4Q06_04710, partial [Bacteroidota bacterium]|nr:hypothetical protein [Bacteroidota bacterium]